MKKCCNHSFLTTELSYIGESQSTKMSDEETSPNNAMDTNVASNETSSPSAQGSSIAAANLDLGIGSGYISGSDDEEMNEPTPSKSSTPDSTTLSSAVTKKPSTTAKHPLTKSLFFFVNTFYRQMFFGYCS